ncbi:MAG: TAXI family TRAP transporter solute-binding subunit [Micropepsaceae bacterium]
MTVRAKSLSWWFAGAGVLSALILVAVFARVTAQTVGIVPQRVSFQISTASITGNDFSVGELLAGILSHPPGISRCETANLCGPAGLIVSTRAADGSVANVLAVNAGAIGSSLAQADVVAQALAGQGAFAGSEPANRLRSIANLYEQTVHLVAATDAGIESVADLRGKRVSLSTEDSGSIVTARAVLQAYRVPEWRMVRNYDSPDIAAQLLRDEELDALFFVGAAPVALVEQLISEGVAILVPLDGVGRDRLLAGNDYASADLLPRGIYSGTEALETINIGTLWITNAATPDTLVYAMVKAIYNPSNRPQIEARLTGRNFLELETAMNGSPTSFHSGALQYFAEAGVLPAPVNPSLPVPKP